jgi:hypothetical protein
MIKTLFLLALLGGSLASAEKLNVPLSDPNRPAMIKASTINGSITVLAHTGKDIIVESPFAPPKSEAAPNGMRQIMGGGSGFTVEEEGNVIRIVVSPTARNGDLNLWVPQKSSLNLKAVNGKAITVDGVDGDLNVEAINGDVRLKDVSGSVVAHSLNGKLLVHLKRVTPDKPMSFSTLNGTVDVTLPTTLAANLKIRNDWGKVYTDFDMTQLSVREFKRESSNEGKPKYRVEMEKTMTGLINGGGPEISFRSMNGTIYIRKEGAR